MRKRPENTLNHAQHDFLVLLAEDLPWQSAAESVGWNPEARTSFYKLMELLEVPLQDDLHLNLEALRAEAKRREYQSQIYYFMFDDEPAWQTIEELGEIPPRFVPVLPRKEVV